MGLSASFRNAFLRVFANHREKNTPVETSDPRKYCSLPNLQWINMLNRNVMLHDGSVAGKIEAISKDNIVIKDGSIRPKRYYVDHSMLKKYEDGHYLIDLVICELSMYKRETVPNPSYYITLGGSYFAYMPNTNNIDHT